MNISPISQLSAPPQQVSGTIAAPKPPAQPADSVHLSAAASSHVRGGDADGDGDGH